MLETHKNPIHITHTHIARDQTRKCYRRNKEKDGKRHKHAHSRARYWAFAAHCRGVYAGRETSKVLECAFLWFSECARFRVPCLGLLRVRCLGDMRRLLCP